MLTWTLPSPRWPKSTTRTPANPSASVSISPRKAGITPGGTVTSNLWVSPWRLTASVGASRTRQIARAWASEPATTASAIKPVRQQALQPRGEGLARSLARRGLFLDHDEAFVVAFERDAQRGVFRLHVGHGPAIDELQRGEAGEARPRRLQAARAGGRGGLRPASAV